MRGQGTCAAPTPAGSAAAIWDGARRRMGAEAAGQATSAGNGRMMRQRWAAWQGDERAGEIRQPLAAAVLSEA